LGDRKKLPTSQVITIGGVTTMRDWKEIRHSWSKMMDMSCKPINPKLKEGTVIDENKTVKWNKEEVNRINALREEEIKKLNTAKNLERDKLEDEIVKKLAEEGNISYAKAKKIYGYAYSQDHSWGLSAVLDTAHELMDFFLEVSSL
jgi:hypothetical protein